MRAGLPIHHRRQLSGWVVLFLPVSMVLTLTMHGGVLVQAQQDDNGNGGGDGGGSGIFSTNCPVPAAACVECVASGCGWIQTGACLADCRYVADIPCYSQDTVGPLPTAQDVCDVLEREREDAAACGAASAAGCAACVATAKPSGGDATYCQWYSVTSSCGTGACNQLGCGETACDGEATTTTEGGEGAGALLSSCYNATTCDECLALDCAWAETEECLGSCSEIADVGCYSSEFLEGTASEICAIAAADRSGSAPTVEPGATDETPAPNATDAPQPTTTTAPPENAAPSPAPAEESKTCQECLTDGMVWAVGECLPSCSVIADAACYSTEYFDGQTPAEICTIAADDAADALLCSSNGTPSDCETCTSTVKSDGASTCGWYTDEESGMTWCGTGECTFQGTCGSYNCTDAVASEPSPTESPAVDSGSTTTTEAPSASSAINNETIADPPPSTSFQRKAASSILLLSVGLLALII